MTSGSTPMPKMRELMHDGGMTASNWYIHTPICSPSRSELLTGRYYHNIKQVGNSVMHVNYDKVNNHTFARIMNEQANYTVSLFGKYLNQMPKVVPPGFDAWMANSGGDYLRPGFQTHGVAGLVDGMTDGHWSGTSLNYSTAVIGNVSIAWIRKVAGEGRPFLAYVAPKAAHEPFIPAPWYVNYWHPTWPEHEPRGDNWNCSAESRSDHHGNIATEPLITEQASKVITGIFKNRWRTLMSVDDVVAGIIAAVDDLGLAGSTYFFFSSDHGFQLGQFNIPMDKRHAYEWDTRIPLLIKGPGVQPGSTLSAPGTQVDIAPTLLGLAGIAAPADMDGRSIVPFLVSAGESNLLPSTQQHLASLGDLDAYRAGWRTEVFVEYYYNAVNRKCMSGNQSSKLTGGWPNRDSWCTDLPNNADCWMGTSDCYATEDTHNNFIALRQFDGNTSRLYVEYQQGNQGRTDINFSATDFVEYYDVAADPWHLRNLAHSTPEAELAPMRKRLHMWYACAGSTCP